MNIGVYSGFSKALYLSGHCESIQPPVVTPQRSSATPTCLRHPTAIQHLFISYNITVLHILLNQHKPTTYLFDNRAMVLGDVFNTKARLLAGISINAARVRPASVAQVSIVSISL